MANRRKSEQMLKIWPHSFASHENEFQHVIWQFREVH
jgi:hypothetical protein